MERYCYLRNVHDKMADGKTAFENVLGKNLTDHSFLSDRRLNTFQLPRKTSQELIKSDRQR